MNMVPARGDYELTLRTLHLKDVLLPWSYIQVEAVGLQVHPVGSAPFFGSYARDRICWRTQKRVCGEVLGTPP